MRRWWKHTTEKTYEEMWSWELREELCGRDATIAEQAATIERFREFARSHDATEAAFMGCVPLALCLELDNERRTARAAITAADMGEAE